MDITTRVVAFARGQPDKLGLVPYDTYAASDRELEEGKKADMEKGEKVRGGFPKLSPLAEDRPGFEAVVLNLEGVQEDKVDESILAQVQDIYRIHVGQFGTNPFGYIIKVVTLKTGNAVQAFVTSIAEKLWPKAATAADVPMFFKAQTTDGKTAIFSGFIKRAAEPGKDAYATVGGFNALNKAEDGLEVFDSPFYTALTEAKEEFRSKFVIGEKEFESLRTNYDLTELKLGIKLKINGKEETFPCTLSKSATIPTSREFMVKGGERIEGTDRLRVHTATAITLTVDFGNKVVTEEDLQNSFKAGDDAGSIHFIDMIGNVKAASTLDGAKKTASEFFKAQKMGILHHADIIAHGLRTAYQKFYGSNAEAGKQVVTLASYKPVVASTRFSKLISFVALGAIAAASFLLFKRFR